MRQRLGAVPILALATVVAVQGEASQAPFVVRATVPPRVMLEPVDAPARLHLSRADIERGYKDVAARYVVRQNTDRGWLLRLTPRLGITRQVEVRGLSAPVVLHDEGVEVYQPRTTGPRPLAVEYRFLLRPDALPGSYELPIHVSASPL